MRYGYCRLNCHDHFVLTASSLFAVTTSGFVFIASNLGTRKAGEASAYSIFNEGFQQIAGTFGAEHMDAQLRQGRLG